MRKLTTVRAARLVKQKNSDWYLIWYSTGEPPQRFRHKFGLNKIKDLALRQQWADAILDFINQKYLIGQTATVLDVQKHFEPSELRRPNAPSTTFLGHVQRFIDLRDNVLSDGTVKVYRTTLNNLNGYAKDKLKKDSMDFQDFDIDFPLRFQSWCYAKPRQHSKNYVSKLFDVVRQFLKDAEEHELPTGAAWKTAKYVLSKTQTDEIALTMDEVEKLYHLELTDLRPVRDLFVLACLTGLRFSDVTRVNSSHIVTLRRKDTTIKALKIDTIKTGEKVIVPLHPFAAVILERSKGLKPPINQIFNRQIKEIGHLANLTEGVTLRVNVAGKQKTETKPKYQFMATHTARRSFATIAYMEYKMPSALIMKITGHRTEKEFFKYIKISKENAAFEMWEYMTK